MPKRTVVIIVSGYDPNVGVATGMLQSFFDAPGRAYFVGPVTSDVNAMVS